MAFEFGLGFLRIGGGGRVRPAPGGFFWLLELLDPLQEEVPRPARYPGTDRSWWPSTRRLVTAAQETALGSLVPMLTPTTTAMMPRNLDADPGRANKQRSAMVRRLHRPPAVPDLKRCRGLQCAARGWRLRGTRWLTRQRGTAIGAETRCRPRGMSTLQTCRHKASPPHGPPVPRVHARLVRVLTICYGGAGLVERKFAASAIRVYNFVLFLSRVFLACSQTSRICHVEEDRGFWPGVPPNRTPLRTPLRLDVTPGLTCCYTRSARMTPPSEQSRRSRSSITSSMLDGRRLAE